MENFAPVCFRSTSMTYLRECAVAHRTLSFLILCRAWCSPKRRSTASPTDFMSSPSARCRRSADEQFCGAMVKMSDAILLEGIELPARLGVSEAERAMRRPVRLDLEVMRDLQNAGRSDALADTIDYQTIYDLVAEVVAKNEFRLVEALAERVAEVLCA